MALEVSRVDVWVAGIKDEPGAGAAKLAALAEGGADLEMVYAGRCAEMPGGALMVVSPLKGARQIKAARKAGFAKSDHYSVVRVAGSDKPGRGAELTRALAEKGVNLAEMSAVVIGRRFVCYLMVDAAADAAKIVRALKKM